MHEKCRPRDTLEEAEKNKRRNKKNY
jgi:hypothetical protein